MADIRIVPGSSIMSFTSSLNFIEKITQDASGSLNLYGSGSTGRTELLSVDGNNGRLFTVSDDLSDSLFSVNTIAGLPVIEAFADNTVKIGKYGQENIVVSGSTTYISGSQDLLIVTENGNGTSWRGRILSKNSTIDKAVFLGNYNGNAGVFSHNNALNAWANLYVNNVDGSSGGNVYLPGTAYVSGNQILHAGNYTSYSPSLTGGNASGTWGISVTGTAGGVAWGNVSSKPTTLSGYGITDSIKSNGTINNNIDSDWGESFTTFDPIPSGTPPLQSPNIRTVNIGNNYDRRTQLAFDYASDLFYFRRRLNSTWGSWREVIHSGNYTSYNSYGTLYVNNWFRAYGNSGFYAQDYGSSLTRTINASHGTWEVSGYNKGSYAGMNIYDASGYINNYMHEGGNGGLYLENQGGQWAFYWSRANACLGLGGSSTSSSYKIYVNGGIYATGDVVAYSDRRKKKNITTIDNALEKVLKLRGVYYDKIDELEKGRKTGVIAQEIQEVLPEVVTYAEDNDEYGVAYGNIVGVLIEAIKEQQTQIEELKQLVNQLIQK